MVENFQHEVLGCVNVYRTRQARRVVIRVTAKGIRVSAPLCTPRWSICAILNRYQESLSQQLTSFRERVEWIEPGFEIESECFSVRVLEDAMQKRPQLKAQAGRFLLLLPPGYNCRNEAFQTWAKDRLVEGMQQRVRAELGPRLEELSRQRNLSYSCLRMSRARTKWASCNSRGTISLNAFMILLPRHLQDFLLQHELTHLQEMNHGPRFHELLNRSVGGREAELNRELNAFRIPKIFL